MWGVLHPEIIKLSFISGLINNYDKKLENSEIQCFT